MGRMELLRRTLPTISIDKYRQYVNGVAAVRSYHKQATNMTLAEQDEYIKDLNAGWFIIEESALTKPFNHPMSTLTRQVLFSSNVTKILIDPAKYKKALSQAESDLKKILRQKEQKLGVREALLKDRQHKLFHLLYDIQRECPIVNGTAEKAIDDRMQDIRRTLRATQAADSIVKFMYGSVLKDNHACDACIKGNGPYSAYVVLNDMSPGCANCHYAEVWAGWYLVKAREIYPFSDIPDTMDHLLATLAAVRMEDPLAVMDMKERAQRDIKHLQEALRTQDRATWVERWMERFPEIATPAIDTNITTIPRGLYVNNGSTTPSVAYSWDYPQELLDELSSFTKQHTWDNLPQELLLIDLTIWADAVNHKKMKLEPSSPPHGTPQNGLMDLGNLKQPLHLQGFVRSHLETLIGTRVDEMLAQRSLELLLAPCLEDVINHLITYIINEQLVAAGIEPSDQFDS
ncbi:hypothetical protein Trihar35433_4798 [Trichoderma harzianum]|nr:hypothetical protein Trihar35433_4798 [Trichoderma harzianum]